MFGRIRGFARRLGYAWGRFRFGLGRFWWDVKRLTLLPVEALRSGELKQTLARDRADIIASGQAVAATTTGTLWTTTWLLVVTPWRFLRWLPSAPARLWYFLRTRTPLQLTAIAGVMLLAVGGFAWPAYRIFRERRIEILRKEQFRQLEEHFIRADADGVRHNIELLAKLTPWDKRVIARRDALNSGAAPADDPQMARLLLRRHLVEGRFADACREARLCAEFHPRDWEALVILATDALGRGDRAAAADFTARLPWSHEPVEAPPPWSCPMAYRLFAELGEKDRLDDLVDFIAERYVPVLRADLLQRAAPGARLQALELYNLALTRLERNPPLTSYWTRAQEHAHGIAESADASVALLTALGRIQDVQLDRVLSEMQRLSLISADDHERLAREIEGRLTKIWARVRSADPKEPMGYIGPAVQFARAGKLGDSVRVMDEGIAAIGLTRELAEWKARFQTRLDPTAALRFLGSALASGKESASLYRVIAETSLAANRPDVAVAAMREANRLQPDQAWACRLEAEVLLLADRPTEAAAVLRRVQPTLAADAANCALYVRALAGSGAVVLAQQFLLEAVDAPRSGPAVIAGADVLLKQGRYEAARAVLRKLVDRDPGNAGGQLLLGEALRRTAELAPGPGWDLEVVSEALKAYRAAAQRYPRDPVIARQIAWLLLMAHESADQAYAAAAPIREMTPPPADTLELLGAVYVGVGEFEKGRAALEESMRLRGKHAITLAWLALAHQGLRDATAAADCINQAVQVPKANPREGEFVAQVRGRIARGVQ